VEEIAPPSDGRPAPENGAACGGSDVAAAERVADDAAGEVTAAVTVAPPELVAPVAA
jgi:hypothetical protein